MTNWRDDDDYTAVDYDECLAETTMAVLLRIDNVKVWVPRSLLSGSEPEKGDGPGIAEVSTWFVFKEGLI